MLIVSGALSARILGPTDRGHAALLVLVPSVLGIAGSLGLSSAVRYAVAQQPTVTHQVLRSLRPDMVAQVVFLTGCHLLITAVWLLPSLPPSARLAGWVALLIVPAIFCLDYTMAVLQGHKRYVAFNIVQVAPQVIYGAGIASLYLTGSGDITLVVLVGTAAAIATGLTALLLARPYLAPSRSSEAAPTRSELRQFARKTYVGQVAPIESFRLDQLVVGATLSPTALGFYGVATAFTNLSRFLGTSIGYVLAPHIASMPPSRRRRSLIRGLSFTALLCGAVTALLVPSTDYLIPLLFGNVFRPAIPIAQVLLFAGFFLGVRRAALAGLQGLGRPEIGSYAELVALAVFLPLVALALKEGTGLAVAWVFLISAVAAMASIVLLLLRPQRSELAPTD